MLTYLHHVNYEEYENASSMLHLVDVLSSDDSPSGPNGPPGEHVTGIMAAAAAVANTTLAGCDNGPAGDASGFTVSVPTLSSSHGPCFACSIAGGCSEPARGMT